MAIGNRSSVAAVGFSTFFAIQMYMTPHTISVCWRSIITDKSTDTHSKPGPQYYYDYGLYINLLLYGLYLYSILYLVFIITVYTAVGQVGAQIPQNPWQIYGYMFLYTGLQLHQCRYTRYSNNFVVLVSSLKVRHLFCLLIPICQRHTR